MKFKFLSLMLLLTALSQSVFTQTDAVVRLKQQISQGNSKAVLEVALEASEAQNVNLRQYLKTLSADGKQRVLYNSPAYFAHIALAKLGDADTLREVLSEVDLNNSVHLVGMKKLFLIGGEPAFKKFYALLDDDTQIEIKENCPEKSSFCNDVFYYPKNIMAIFYLSQMVENPPTRRGVPSNQVSLWKEWFMKHKNLIE